MEPVLGPAKPDPGDDEIISMYARGMSVREIRGHLEELYGIDVSPGLISAVTDAVLEEVAEWQNRPLDACFPLVFFDAIRVKIRDEGFVRNKAIYIALGILADGTKEILGIWIEQTEGAKPAFGLDPWVLAARHERTEVARPRRHSDRRGRRAEGLSRGHQRRLFSGGRADLHRAPDPPFARVRLLEGPQDGDAGAQGHLPGQGRRGRHEGAGGVRGRLLGPALSGHRAQLAAQLGARRPVLRLPRKRAPDHLHHG
jgi:putative transposase